MNQCDIDVEQKELEILELELKEDVNTCSNVVQQDSIDDEQKEIVNLEDNVVEQEEIMNLGGIPDVIAKHDIGLLNFDEEFLFRIP